MRLSFLRLWPGPISATITDGMGDDNPKNLSAAADFLRSHMSKFAGDLSERPALVPPCFVAWPVSR